MHASTTDTIAAQDTRADSFNALGNAHRARLNQRLYDSLAQAHRSGKPALSRRELRDWHHLQTAEWLEMSSISSTVNALVAAGKVEEVAARQCSLPPHRLVRPVRCVLRQTSIGDIGGCAQ